MPRTVYNAPHQKLPAAQQKPPPATTHPALATIRRGLATALALGLLAGLAACSWEEDQASPGITGYNHTTNRSIYNFTVNGRLGAGMGPMEGGGATSCCVAIPRTWHPGLKVKVAWEYQNFRDVPAPQPERREAEVDVPQYSPSDIGRLAVHFFPDHKVRVLVTMLSIQHPDYPAALRWGAPTPQ